MKKRAIATPDLVKLQIALFQRCKRCIFIVFNARMYKCSALVCVILAYYTSHTIYVLRIALPIPYVITALLSLSQLLTHNMDLKIIIQYYNSHKCVCCLPRVVPKKLLMREQYFWRVNNFFGITRGKQATHA